MSSKKTLCELFESNKAELRQNLTGIVLPKDLRKAQEAVSSYLEKVFDSEGEFRQNLTQSEDYILEAETYRLSETQKSKIIKISPAACFSIGLVACACLVLYLVFGGSNLIKMENGSESTAESVLKDDTQGSAHLTDSEQDAASNSSTEELESDTMNNAEVHIQGLILDGTDGDIASIIVEVDRKASEVDYKQVMFYLDENNKKWVDAVGSIVKIHLYGVNFAF
jgi:hypothetical protein